MYVHNCVYKCIYMYVTKYICTSTCIYICVTTCVYMYKLSVHVYVLRALYVTIAYVCVCLESEDSSALYII